MELVPSKFFTVRGSAVSKTSDLNAFDIALLKAGIGEQNLVSVSSVIPEGAYRKDGKGGYVAEGHIHGSAESLREILSWKMEEMARIRDVEFGEIKFEAEELEIPLDHYGCCVSALVFTEYR